MVSKKKLERGQQVCSRKYICYDSSPDYHLGGIKWKNKKKENEGKKIKSNKKSMRTKSREGKRRKKKERRKEKEEKRRRERRYSESKTVYTFNDGDKWHIDGQGKRTIECVCVCECVYIRACLYERLDVFVWMWGRLNMR